MVDLKLKGKKALITGGSSGMGRETAIMLAGEGADVAINYSRNDEKASSLVKELEKSEGKIVLVKGDVGEYRQTEKIVKKTVEKIGGIDILVHSAGIAQPREDTPENWDRVMKVHLYSCYNLRKFAVPVMKEKKGGTIIIVSSIAAHDPGSNAYCVAMAGKICFAKGLTKELAPFNINVNTVSPGTIFTPMLDPFIPENKRREFAENNIPLYKNRAGYPQGDEIARVILFLASDLGRHMTGEDIKVDGGQFIHY